MKLRDFSFIGMVVLVVSGLQTLSLVNKPPAMPKDIHHVTVSRDARAQCLRCHRAEAMLALEQRNRHPEKWRDARSDCLLCHIPAGGAKRKAEPIVARPPCAIPGRQKHPWRIAMTRQKE
jgi:nitrate reductase cytochrome c-type subunit